MERYADELAHALHQLGSDVHSAVAARPLPSVGGMIGTLLNYGWRSIAYPRFARHHQGDVNHIIDHTYAHLVDALDAQRTIVTCHDLAPIEFDAQAQFLSHRLWQRSFRAMLRAAHIIVDSAHTRDAILRQSNYPAAQITVVALAVSPTFFQRVPTSQQDALRARHQVNSRHVVLHVGSCQPRKNIENLLQALDTLHDLNPILVQLGGRFSPAQMHLIESKGLTSNILQINPVSENELHAWYQTANAFVFPSFYEGFGLPLLEAMASGTPVICANTSSLPEVVGKAALMFDAHDPDKLASALRSVLTDTTLASDLQQRGLERAKMFTWANCAQETLDVYRRVAQM